MQTFWAIEVQVVLLCLCCFLLLLLLFLPYGKPISWKKFLFLHEISDKHHANLADDYQHQDLNTRRHVGWQVAHLQILPVLRLYKMSIALLLVYLQLLLFLFLVDLLISKTREIKQPFVGVHLTYPTLLLITTFADHVISLLFVCFLRELVTARENIQKHFLYDLSITPVCPSLDHLMSPRLVNGVQLRTVT